MKLLPPKLIKITSAIIEAGIAIVAICFCIARDTLLAVKKKILP